MNDAPERIWATGNGTTGSWNHEKGRMRVHMSDDWQTEYVRADLANPTSDERVMALVEAAQALLTILDSTIEESGRSIDYGEEDAFRMGEWFEEDDYAAIGRARAALAALQEGEG